jgi:DUSP domain
MSRASVFTGRRISEEEVTFYEKPNKITNAKLLDPNGRLLSTLVEHYDFVVVDQVIWKHLSSWYDFDHQICRRLIQDPESLLKLDLYPDELLIK